LGFDLASEKATQSPDGMAHKLPGIKSLYSDNDTDFTVQLNGAAMARYMAGPSVGVNSKSFHAHLAAFTACVKILQRPIDATGTLTPEGILQKYAAEKWIVHLHYLHLIDSEAACATDADVEVVVETLLRLHVDGRLAAENMFRQKSNCCGLFCGLQSEGDEMMKRWFSRYNPAHTTDTTHTSNTTLAKGLAKNPRQFFVSFVRWHAEIAVEQVTDNLILDAFEQVYLAYWTVSSPARPLFRKPLI
jgi:hypothetical protein